MRASTCSATFDDRASQVALDRFGSRRPVLGIEAVQFAGRTAGLDQERLAVDGRSARRRGEEAVEVHSGRGGEGLAQLVAFAVVAAEADCVNLTDPERDQVVEDRAGRAGLAADLRRRCRPVKPVSIEVSFLDGSMCKIAVEEKVAHDGDSQLCVRPVISAKRSAFMSRPAGDRDDGRTSDYHIVRSEGHRPCGSSSCRT